MKTLECDIRDVCLSHKDAIVVSSEGQQYNDQHTVPPSWSCLSEGVDITYVSLGSISKSTPTDNTPDSTTADDKL